MNQNDRAPTQAFSTAAAQWRVNGTEIRPIDAQLAKQILAYQRTATPELNLEALECAVIEVSVALGKGQVCVALEPERAVSLSPYTVIYKVLAVTHSSNDADEINSAMAYANQPLVLAHGKLYIARYYFYEQNVLQQIQQRLAVAPEVDADKLTAVLAQLFPTQAEIDWQKVAAASACLQHFNVITGGPGTGKTTTVTKLLSALLELNPALNIALAAPTGKAAARMTESIRGAKLSLTVLPHKERIPDSSFTLHRLLGWHPRGFRYHSDHHLPFDCVVVDEASMIDLPMMSHLLAALAPSAKLILLGDRDQLASVEVGSVLADLCDAGNAHGPNPIFAARLAAVTGYDVATVSEADCSPLQNAVAQLRKSYRFNAQSGIGQLAYAVNTSAVAAAQQALLQYDDIQHQPLQGVSLGKNPVWQTCVLEGFKPYAEALRQHDTVAAMFHAFNQFQVLVAMRQGPYGVEQVNLQLAHLLQQQGLLGHVENSLWYHGRPVMISRNDYDLNLFNGDIGLTLKLPDGRLKVAFQTADGGVRWLLPSRLPAHETALAMTVHKSQGSEFSHVCLVLPEQWQSMITRELIYTAITRAKQRFTLFADADCWQQGLQAQVQRASGLRDILWPSESALP